MRHFRLRQDLALSNVLSRVSLVANQLHARLKTIVRRDNEQASRNNS